MAWLISENRRLAEERDAARAAEQERTRLLIAAAHDLLQPVNAARLWLSVLDQSRAGQDGPAILAQVERALETADSFLTALLSAARLDAGLMTPEIAPTPLVPILSAICASFEVQAQARGLRCRIRVSEAVVKADGVMLQRILHNLVSNAVRYTERGGVLVATRLRGDACWIDVHDTGPGIRPEDQAAIFQEFRRAAAGLRTHDLSLGLGLSVASRMAEAMGGRIELRSRPGRGSRFRLVLPLAQEKGIADHAFAPARDVLAGALVLVADPVRTSRERLLRMLSGWSCFAVSVGRVEELKILTDHLERAPDVVLADEGLMAQPDGRGAVQRLRSAFRRSVPLVLLGDGEAAGRGRDKRGRFRLPKTAPAAEVRALVSHLLSGGR